MGFHSSWAFFFFIPLLLVLIAGYIYRDREWGFFKYSSLSSIKKIAPSLRVRTVWLPKLLKVLGICCAIYALARPQESSEKIKKNIEGIDIMMTLDVSESMLIEDMKPTNRLESAKKTIEEFINKRTSDRIGVVVFSGESYTRVPLTLDYNILLDNIKQIKTTRTIKMGTAIGVALANAVSRIKDSNAKSRVVILLTDGENNTGLIDPLTALKIAKDFGIRIYSIGVGMDGDARLPIYSKDVFGRTTKRYQKMHSSVNVSLLSQLAEETGGKFYRASNTNALQGVFSDIDQLEKSKIEVNKFTKYEELFQKWLLLGIALYGIGLFLQNSLYRRGL